jgi:hypothetical protein
MMHPIHLQILPVEYGGSNGTLAELTEYWKVHQINYILLWLSTLFCRRR